MTDGQLALGLTRHTDPGTSRGAAGAQRGGAIPAILATFARHPDGLIDDELVARIPEQYGPTLKTARSRLYKAGRLVKTGELRKSSRGFLSEVYKLSAVTPAA